MQPTIAEGTTGRRGAAAPSLLPRMSAEHWIQSPLWDGFWMFAAIWGSTFVADGKVYCGNEDGELVILKAGREKEEIARVDFYTPIYGTPVVANNTLYVTTQTHIFAIGR